MDTKLENLQMLYNTRIVNPYKILGILDQDFSEKNVKKHYRKYFLQLYPDLPYNSLLELQKSLVLSAYKFLEKNNFNRLFVFNNYKTEDLYNLMEDLVNDNKINPLEMIESYQEFYKNRKKLQSKKNYLEMVCLDILESCFSICAFSTREY